MMVYFNKLTEDRRANPTGDLASAIANGTIDGQPLDPLAMYHDFKISGCMFY